MTRDPTPDAVTRALGVTIQKQEREIAMLRRALLTAAEQLERAGWRQSAELARDVAQ